MILDVLGKLSTAQDLTAGSTDSENVILMQAVDWTQYDDVFWYIATETIATGDGSDTYQFQLIASQEATLDTNKQILSITITGYASYPIATAGNTIVAINILKHLNTFLGTDASDYPYLGIISTISAGATISINAAISPSEPPTPSHEQVTVSNVGTPDVAS